MTLTKIVYQIYVSRPGKKVRRYETRTRREALRIFKQKFARPGSTVRLSRVKYFGRGGWICDRIKTAAPSDPRE